MTSSTRSFHDFEHDGWEDTGVVATYHEHLSVLTTQSADALLDAAAVREGTRVLDVATGAGYVAGLAAKRGAKVTGIDFSAAQVRLARAQCPGVRFEQADAEALPFDACSFDALVNAFGMCHFPHPELALREAFRVLSPGGRIAFTVWDVPERAVPFGALYAAVRAHGSMDVGLPAGPNFFLYSDPAQSTQALRDAGFASPACRQVPQFLRLSDADRLYDLILAGTVRAAATLRAQSAQAREAIRAALRETVAAYRRGDAFELPAPAMLATAVKP